MSMNPAEQRQGKGCFLNIFWDVSWTFKHFKCLLTKGKCSGTSGAVSTCETCVPVKPAASKRQNRTELKEFQSVKEQ